VASRASRSFPYHDAEPGADPDSTYERESRTFSQESGRRPAGYVVATSGSKSFDDPGHRHHQRLARTGRHLGAEPRKGPAIARHVEALALAWGVSKLPFVPDIIRAASHQ
jgi:hypothetical protein